MNLAALTTAIALTASAASACDAYALHLGSYHTDRTLIEDVNEANFGLGCRIGGYEVGGFKNSYGDFSAYALRDWTHDSGLGVFGGVASGYQKDIGVPDHGVMLMGGAVFQGDIVTVRAAPSFSKQSGGKGVVVSLSLSIGALQ